MSKYEVGGMVPLETVLLRGEHLGGGGEVQGVKNAPRSAWVKTDAASKTANATSVETRFGFVETGSVGCYPRAARYIPQVPPLVLLLE